MPNVIYFRLGDRDRITLGSLLSSMRDVKGLLQDFDAALSHDPRGTLRWEVAVLEKRSPVLLGVIPEISNGPHAQVPSDFPMRIENAVLDSTAQLSYQAERTPVVSDSALKRYHNLASRTRRIGEISVFTDKQHIPINETTLQNIRKLIGAKTRSTGSILGTLDTISVHRHNEIRVWDDNTNRPITCRYPSVLEEVIKASLRKRVLVSGVVSFNEVGRAIAVDVATIEPYPTLAELPTIEQISGLIDDVTGGESLATYLEHLRDG